MPRYRLLIRCPDRPGIVASVSRFLFDHGANIVHSDQHSTPETPAAFFMRIEFEVSADTPDLATYFQPVATTLGLDYRLVPETSIKKIAVFVSHEDHCLMELLWHTRSGDIPASIELVLGNHPEMADIVRPFGIPFHHVPVTAATKEESEQRQLELIRGKVDAIVLAKYMQILSPAFLTEWEGKVLNIHHSFLPAFAGARPYHQAYERGVKLIGATAHYVTAELDAGPIIEQDVARVDHRSDPSELRRLGRAVERSVLARAVKWHVEDRVIVHAGRTVVFA